MVSQRTSAGDSPAKGPLNSKIWNNVLESSNDHHDRRAMGSVVTPPPGLDFGQHALFVKVENTTGEDVREGEVLELTGSAVTELFNRKLMLAGVDPNLERVGWGITAAPIPAGEINRIFIFGACLAYVVIKDETHKYADRVSGSRVLESSASGPVKILHKPTGETPPEERECVVQLVDEIGDIVDMIEVVDTGKSAGELTYPTAEHAFAHRGKVRRFTSTGVTFTDAGDCWLLLTNEWGVAAGDVPAVNHQYYGPAKYVGIVDLDGEALPTYVYCRSELATEIIEVTHESATNGDVVAANSDGYHPAKIRRRAADGSYADGGDVWLQFVTAFANYGAVAGEMLAVQGQYYGPARYAETWDKVTGEGEEATHDKRPVYVCECSELSFLGEFEDSVTSGSSAGTFKIFHSRTLANSGFTKEVITWGSNATAGKKGAIEYVAGRWVGAQTEC